MKEHFRYFLYLLPILAQTFLAHAQTSPCGNKLVYGDPTRYLNCYEKVAYDEVQNVYLLRRDLSTPFDGTCEVCTRGGLLIERISVKMGKRDGVDTSYTSNGCISSVQSYTVGIPNGTFLFFNDTTGMLEREENYQMGKKHGPTKQYYRSGKLYSSLNYNFKIPDGPQLYYFEDGTLMRKDMYNKGVMDGLQVVNGPNGKPISETNYKLGKKHGKTTYYADAGAIIGVENWYEGKRNGLFEKYNEAGTLLSRREFNKEIPVGEHFENDAKGRMIHQIKYDKKGVRLYEMEIDEYGDKKVLYDANKPAQKIDDDPALSQQGNSKKAQKKKKKEKRKKE